MYTANILFAPLGADRSPPVAGSSSNPEVPHEGVDMKVVYDLATKVSAIPLTPTPPHTGHQISLEPLRALAGQKIESSMTRGNIVEELLSPFSAEYVSWIPDV